MPSAPLQLRAQVNPQDLSALHAAAKAAEGTVQVELRRGIKAAAAPMVRGVKAEASWSKRIPGAVKTSVSFAKKGATVKIVVDAKRAPEAAPLNNAGKSSAFRHPVFGSRENWVNQKSRPFFLVGAKRGFKEADAAMVKVMDEIAAKLGFKG